MMNKDIQRIIGRLNEVKKDTDPQRRDSKVRRFLVALHNLGYEVAKVGYLDSGIDGITVTDDPIWQGNTMILEAHGVEILFVEFGTGIYQDGNPRGRELGFTKRSWSKEHRHFLEHGDWWVYQGDPDPYSKPATRKRKDGTEVARPGWYETTGHEAFSGMYNAGKEMRNAISELAKEYFG